jgi:hypothetical protein
VCAGKQKNFSHTRIKPSLFDPESVIQTGSYPYRECISQIKFLKFLNENSSDCVTKMLGHIKVDMNKPQMITYKNGKESGSLLA